MKSYILTLLLCFSFALSAQSNHFEIENLGLVCEVPEFVEHSWRLSHIPSGTEFNLFYSQGENEIGCAIALINYPCNSVIGNEFEGLCTKLIELYKEIDFDIHAQEIESLAPKAFNATANRVRFAFNEEGFDLMGDVHGFIHNGQQVFVITAMEPTHHIECLEVFTETFLETIELKN